MRIFGWLFLGVGLLLAAISVRAVLDSNTIYEGWERFRQDPWVAGIVVGAALAAVGGLLLGLAPREGARTRVIAGRALAVLVFGFVGFALFAPFGSTIMCSFGSPCETQSWTTVTGMTFDGEVDYGPGLVAAGAGATVAGAVIVWRARSR